MTNKWLVYGLSLLQFILVGIIAFTTGIIMIIDSSGNTLDIPLEILNSSPFADFLIPGIFLTFFNGIGNIIGGIATFKNKIYAGNLAIALGVFLIIWIVLQIYWIGLNSFLQTVYLFFGIIEVILGVQIKKLMISLT